LTFYQNQIGNEGAKFIGECLKHNSTLTNINCDRNKIDDEGAKSIFESLEHNSSLTISFDKEQRFRAK